MLAFPLRADTDPGTAALEYLGKLREKKVSTVTGKDTAISPETTDDKRKEISRTLERLSQELAEGTLELGEIKQDGGTAGVIVRQIDGFDVNAMQVIALAMVKRGDDWLPAPIPASFDNTGLGYDPVLAQNLPALEEWMLRQRVVDLQILRAESTLRMQRQIAKSLPKEKLAAMKQDQVVEGFMKACALQDLSAVLGYLGGLNQTLPEDWSVRSNGAAKAISKKESEKSPWRLLLSPDVFRFLAHTEMTDDEGTVSFACLDPTEKSTTFLILHVGISKSDEGLWQIDLPSAFFNRDEELPKEEEIEAEILDTLPHKLRKKYPSMPQATAEEAGEILLTKLRGNSLSDLLPLISWEGTDAPSGLKNIMRAAQTWRALHDPGTVGCPLKMAFHEEGNEAAVITQFFSTHDPERTDLRVLQFQKNDKGWMWTPLPVADPAPDSDGGKIANWVKDQRPIMASQWQGKLLTGSSEIKSLVENHAVSPEEAHKTLTEWISSTRDGDLEKALALTAWINDGRGASRMLRNLGHEMATASKEKASAEIVEIYHSTNWAAVGVKTSSEDTPANFPLYPVIQTDKGPRILLEVDLFASPARGREFLNKASLERLQSVSSPALAEDLGKLLETYKKRVLK